MLLAVRCRYLLNIKVKIKCGVSIKRVVDIYIFFDWFLVVANSEGEMANGSSVCNGSCNVCWSEGGNG